MGRILIVDDERGIRRILRDLLVEHGHEVAMAESGEEALGIAPAFVPDLVLMDLHLPGKDGAETSSELLARDPNLRVVVVTAYGSIRSAVELTKAGVYDYVTKPFDNDDLLAAVERALEARNLERRVSELEGALMQQYGFDEIVSVSDSMRAVFERMQRVASVDVPVLIVGESGTGKELVARAIHHRGPRRGGPLIAVNCGAIPDELVENEFFGHEAGAFTDAKSTSVGSFQAADGGTLFLDEIGSLPLPAQAKLLRALQDRAVVRIGGHQPIPVDIRLIAATNAALEQLIQQGRFREDLYYRLNVVGIRLPPLRERREDIPLLAEHFLKKSAADMGLSPRRLAPDAVAKLSAYGWPGNVRELENVIQSAMVLSQEDEIHAEHLSARLAGEHESLSGESFTLAGAVESATEELERRLIHEALLECGGSRTRAAARLGIGRKTLFNKMRRYGLE